MSRRTLLTTVVLIVLAWASMITFGGILAETVMLYPNIFRDPPASLVLAREFVDPVGTRPADYLRDVAAEFNAGHWVRWLVVR